MLDDDVQDVIVNATLPWAQSSSSNGIFTAKIFLLSMPEIGFKAGSSIANNQYIYNDGAKLSYFAKQYDSSGNNNYQTGLYAYYNGSAHSWATRSSSYWSNSNPTGYVYHGIAAEGYCTSFRAAYINDTGSLVQSTGTGIRPALILPHTALFDEETMVLKGAA